MCAFLIIANQIGVSYDHKSAVLQIGYTWSIYLDSMPSTDSENVYFRHILSNH